MHQTPEILVCVEDRPRRPPQNAPFCALLRPNRRRLMCPPGREIATCTANTGGGFKYTGGRSNLGTDWQSVLR
jgi:hypothetical protein